MHKLERRITVVAVVVPFLGFLAAIPLTWGGLTSWRDLAIFAVMYVITGFGVTVGFHRLFTHRSFTAVAPVRAWFAIAGSMSVQGSVITWVADHRKHHTFADEEGDPHSPHLHQADGVRGIIGGLWHAHTGWLFDMREKASHRRYAADLRSDPLMVFVDKWFLGWVLLGLALPFLAGFIIGGSLTAGLTALVWGGLVRIFLQHHATWSVNSICHMYGERPFEIEDQSRNNWGVALVSLGEGWHHNHHAFPTSARHGLRKVEIDPSYYMIKGLEKLNLVREVKVPTDVQLEKKRAVPAA
ncbi:MAG TPA: fatty acid desaturase [Baekduia sp.]|nr:fatty acid desaturase [Baekduia sp.]